MARFDGHYRRSTLGLALLGLMQSLTVARVQQTRHPKAQALAGLDSPAIKIAVSASSILGGFFQAGTERTVNLTARE